MKTLDLDGEIYVFETLEQLVLMLKDAEYEIDLNIRRKGKIRKNVIKLK